MAHRGLAPHLVEFVSLLADAGLPVWLGHEGRPIHIEEAQGNPTDAAERQVARELGLLQAVMAVPLLSHGELVAILKPKGSGLALAICRGTTDTHRGTIRAETNRRRQGTTMVVEFPTAVSNPGLAEPNVIRG